MDIIQLQDKLRNELGWRVGDEMAAYLLARLAGGGAIPLLACDARTGRAICVAFDTAAQGGGKKVVMAPTVIAPVTTGDQDGQFLLFPG